MDVAYYLNPRDNVVVATRTEYIPDTFALKRNARWTAVFAVAIAAVLVLLLLSVRKSLLMDRMF